MIRLTAEHAEYAEIYKSFFSALFALSPHRYALGRCAVRQEIDYDF